MIVRLAVCVAPLYFYLCEDLIMFLDLEFEDIFRKSGHFGKLRRIWKVKTFFGNLDMQDISRRSAKFWESFSH